MSIGSRHDEIGLLRREVGHLVQLRDDGGRWRLDVTPDAELLVGRRVRITGMRSGFDLMDVATISPEQV